MMAVFRLVWATGVACGQVVEPIPSPVRSGGGGSSTVVSVPIDLTPSPTVPAMTGSTVDCDVLVVGGCPQSRASTGNPGLDRAMAICDGVRFEVPTTTSNLVPLGDWPPAYKPWCERAQETWLASDAARREREAAAKKAADLDWLRAWAEGK
jgi:hypothetical protein